MNTPRTCSAFAMSASAALALPARVSVRTAASQSCSFFGFFKRACSSSARALAAAGQEQERGGGPQQTRWLCQGKGSRRGRGGCFAHAHLYLASILFYPSSARTAAAAGIRSRARDWRDVVVRPRAEPKSSDCSQPAGQGSASPRQACSECSLKSRHLLRTTATPTKQPCSLRTHRTACARWATGQRWRTYAARLLF